MMISKLELVSSKFGGEFVKLMKESGKINLMCVDDADAFQAERSYVAAATRETDDDNTSNKSSRCNNTREIPSIDDADADDE